ncbi:hypothetical protein QJ48_16175 [Paenibacillus sp. A3]|nr:hypothetical protein QJ48_16175 [Paenibacillus sp. A3]
MQADRPNRVTWKVFDFAETITVRVNDSKFTAGEMSAMIISHVRSGKMSLPKNCIPAIFITMPKAINEMSVII